MTLPTTLQNPQWIYQQVPDGQISAGQYRQHQQSLCTALAADQVLLEAEYWSVDPYMRINQSKQDTWMPPHPLETVQGGGAVNKIIASNSATHAVGRYVLAHTGWQRYAIAHISQLDLIPELTESRERAEYLGVLGMPGRTAWFGLTEAGRVKPMDVVLVSGAAGAVGHIVVQLAKAAGAKVIGIAGESEKCRWLQSEFALDAVINYRDCHDASSAQSALRSALASIGRTSIDVYFDNTGGPFTDASFGLLNQAARVVICGQMSQYSGQLDAPELAPRFLHQVLYQRVTIQGILARDYAHRIEEQRRHLRPLLQAGLLKSEVTIQHGFERLPGALQQLFSSQQRGKLLVKA